MSTGKKVAVLLPIKDHSERIPDKNFQMIGNIPLHEVLVKRLADSQFVDNIYINTDSKRIIDYYKNKKDITIIKRDPSVVGDFVSMNDVIASSLDLISEDVILQTHATNPLVSLQTFENAITKFFQMDADVYDSLFSVNKLYKRFYDKDFIPINHDPSILLRTQDLNPLLVENSCIYLFSKSSFANSKMRIGKNPYLFEMNEYEAIDVDWPEDLETVRKLSK